ncbi:MAG: guanylate kinase [Phycisphaerales bacterium JB063]
MTNASPLLYDNDPTPTDAPMPPNDAEHHEYPGLLVILSGPSGAGKTTISRAVRERMEVAFSVSLTTRPLSAEDTDGEDYIFVNEREFKEQVKLGQLLEWAQVHDNFYGTPREPVIEELEAGGIVLLEIDVQGARQVKANLPDAVGIFVEPPSEEELLARLRARKREDEATIQKRFQRATAEITQAHELGIYDLTIINCDLDKAIQQAIDFIEAQHVKRQARA